jgi:hypothetical protein
MAEPVNEPSSRSPLSAFIDELADELADYDARMAKVSNNQRTREPRRVFIARGLLEQASNLMNLKLAESDMAVRVIPWPTS